MSGTYVWHLLHVNSTPHLARFTHANFFSRMAQAELMLRSSHCFIVISQKGHLHRHSSCLTRNAHGLTAFLFHLRTALRPYFIFQREYTVRPVTCRSVWPSFRTEQPLQVLSPTIPSRLAVRRLRLCSYHRQEHVLVRLTILARTLLLPLHHRKWMKDKFCECWLHCCSHKREASAVVARKMGCPLSANSSNICSAIWSQAPCGLFSEGYHFFSETGPINDH